ncbi:MAG TPA: hypothetical protein VKR83_02925 [Ktedonobacteraceae bacterium]|nr:hypothetical protein [Ktedonobacteraceae bacterium]
MNSYLTRLSQLLRNITVDETGQDLVEYALTLSLIAFGSIASMQFLAGGINNAFSQIAEVITTNIT